jgi:hypothetical protein
MNWNKTNNNLFIFEKKIKETWTHNDNMKVSKKEGNGRKGKKSHLWVEAL